MRESDTSQSALSRMSGVRQPTISQILSGQVGASDRQLQRLLFCMGYDLHVIRRLVRPTLTPSEARSWRLHRLVSSKLTRESLEQWAPLIEQNLSRLESGVRGEPHVSNLGAWRRLLESDDVQGLHRVLTGLDRSSIEMREVSPLSGLLTDDERRSVLRKDT